MNPWPPLSSFERLVSFIVYIKRDYFSLYSHKHGRGKYMRDRNAINLFRALKIVHEIAKPREKTKRLLGEKPNLRARRLRWWGKGRQVGGGWRWQPMGQQNLSQRSMAYGGQWGRGGSLLSTVQWTCWLEVQLKTFISTVTKSLRKSVYDSPSKACNELLDIIKGSCPTLVAEGEAS